MGEKAAAWWCFESIMVGNATFGIRTRAVVTNFRCQKMH